MLGITLGWVAFVVVVATLAIRPWGKPERRAVLPVCLAVTAAVLSLWRGVAAYNDLIDQGLWTAATITIPYVPGKALFYTLLSYVTGRALAGTLRFDLAASLQTLSLIKQGARIALVSFCAYLAYGEVQQVRESALDRIARDPNISTEQLTKLVGDIDSGTLPESVIYTFLGNPKCPPALLQKYASGSKFDKTSVARNPLLPTALAEQLANDSDATVRYYAAGSEALEIATLTRLAHDPDRLVRERVAWNPNLPDDDLVRLAADPEAQVRSTVSMQSRLSEQVLRQLLNDPVESVRNMAQRQASIRGIE